MYKNAKSVFAATLEQIRQEGLYKEERMICSQQGATIAVQTPVETLIERGGKPPISPDSKEVIVMCSNNYLGLSSHPELIKAAHVGLDERGFGMSSVRFICGTQDIHRLLENKVSAFLGMEDTILFGSCFDANAALFETLLGPEDAIFSDKLVHASLIDGMRLCKAPRFIYEHQNLNQLEEFLEKSPHSRVKLIITDGVFSMDGDMAQLDRICDIADRYNALVAVDDSHATGFIGRTGRGTHEHFEVMDRVDIITTTFGKALGGATGGCISARKEIVSLLKQRARPYLFSNALMPAVVTATLKSLDLLMESTERRDRLQSHTEFWRRGLTEAGFDLKAGNTPIVPVMLYDAKLAQEFSKELFKEGIYAVGFFYPVVPKGEARIRTQLSAALTKEHLETALAAFIKVGKKLNVLN